MTSSELQELCKFPTFIGLAILQAIFLHISSNEYMNGRLNGGYARRSKLASTIAFIGICTTLILGVGVYMDKAIEFQILALGLPFLFIGGWAVAYRDSSKNIDPELLYEEVNAYYEELIERCIEFDHPASKKHLFELCNKRLKKELRWEGAVNIALTHLPELRQFTVLRSAVSSLQFNRVQFDILVAKLEKSGKIRVGLPEEDTTTVEVMPPDDLNTIPE